MSCTHLDTMAWDNWYFNSFAHLVQGINSDQEMVSTPTRVVFFDLLPPIVKIEAGDCFSMVLLANGSLYAMGHKDRCGQASAINNFVSPVQVVIPNTHLTFVCCSKACTLVQSSSQWFAFGQAGILGQDAPAFGKPVTSTATVIHDSFPQVSIVKLVASYFAFFLLSNDGTVYVVGNGRAGDMGIQNGKNIDKWTVAMQNVHRVFAGQHNSFFVL